MHVEEYYFCHVNSKQLNNRQTPHGCNDLSHLDLCSTCRCWSVSREPRRRNEEWQRNEQNQRGDIWLLAVETDREWAGASDASSLRRLSTLRARGRNNTETLVPPQLWPPLQSFSSPLLLTSALHLSASAALKWLDLQQTYWGFNMKPLSVLMVTLMLLWFIQAQSL